MIIITGFEPFGGERSNPSWDAVFHLPDSIGGQAIQKIRLPVSYQGCFAPLGDAIKDPACKAVICVGQAGGRSCITPECVAINRMHAAAPDQDGRVMTHMPIEKGGRNAYFSTLPVPAMVDRMHQAGIPATASYHTGTYVCNTLFYRLMHSIETERYPMLGGFIHVPYSAEQAIAKNAPPPSMALSTIIQGLHLCAEEVLCALASFPA